MARDQAGTDESRRLDALEAYRIVDTAPEAVFDDLVQTAATLAAAPMALLGFVDERRQWFKASQGIPFTETPREIAFCEYTIRRETPMVVTDARSDPRFLDNPLVTAEPHIRFYAGIPLSVRPGVVVGTLAVMDVVPREPAPALVQSLQGLARLAVALLRSRLQALRTEDRLDREQRRGALIQSQERELKAAHAELKFHLENTPLALVEMDQDTRIRRWSRQAQELFGHLPAEVLGRRLEEIGLVHPADMAAVAEVVDELVSGRRRRNACTNRNLTRSGQTLICKWYNSARRDDSGNLLSLQSFASDITAQVATEEQLGESRQLLEIAGRVAQIGGWRVDLETNRIQWSDEVAAIHDEPPGTSPEVERGIGYYAPEYRARIRALFEACVERGESYDEELQILTARGRRVWVRTIGEPVRNGEGRIVAIQGAFQDISRRKASEEELRRSEERYRYAAEASQAALWDYDMLTDEITFSDAFRDMLGYDLDALPRTMTGYMELMHPDDRERIRKRAEELISGVTGDLASAEFRLRTASGQYRWFQSNSKLIRDEAGRPVRRLGSTIDIHDQRIAEQQVRQSQRLEAVGQLTGGVAHDFNNLLTVILGNADVLANQLRDAPEQGYLAEMIAAAAQRGAELTHRLLAFARRQPLQPRPTDVTALIAGMQGLLERSLPETITMEIAHGEELWPADIDPSQLESALLNLALNARDAMPDGGVLTIMTASEHVRASKHRSEMELAPGDYLVVTVADTGTGIAPERRDRLFDPFFTTKDQGKGTGLGLAMVYGFIKQSSGHVTVESEPGKGTRFRLYLPRAQAPIQESAAAAPAAKPAGGAEKILIVEDDPLVRDHVQRLLETLGYRTETAPDALAALRLLESGGAFDLVFSDVVMPGGMSGFDLAAEAQARFPRLPVLLTSGYTEAARSGNAIEPGDILQKPYSRAALARRIRSLLN